MSKHSQRHVYTVLVGYTVEEFEQHLLRHLDFSVALPSVPHAVGAVENDEHTSMLIGTMSLCHDRTHRQEQR